MPSRSVKADTGMTTSASLGCGRPGQFKNCQESYRLERIFKPRKIPKRVSPGDDQCIGTPDRLFEIAAYPITHFPGALGIGSFARRPPGRCPACRLNPLWKEAGQRDSMTACESFAPTHHYQRRQPTPALSSSHGRLRSLALQSDRSIERLSSPYRYRMTCVAMLSSRVSRAFSTINVAPRSTACLTRNQ